VSEPTVCCVMLTKGRPAMAKQAIAAFRAQTYKSKRLLVFNSGSTPLIPEAEALDVGSHIHEPCVIGLDATETIGELRNEANAATEEMGAEIIAHMDDDDWSHPNRLSEQVALLQSSGAECVGYSDLLFWREGYDTGRRIPDVRTPFFPRPVFVAGEAWLYTAGNPAHCPGTTMMYTRASWEARPFEALPSPEKPWLAEDQVWQRGVKLVMASSVGVNRYEPRMIARIHGGNTSKAYDPELMRASEAQGGQWKRVPQWDSYCRSVFK
jgi:glycosyltransferase involved in cell wall biosynthesis